jgi:hypothetical protein
MINTYRLYVSWALCTPAEDGNARKERYMSAMAARPVSDAETTALFALIPDLHGEVERWGSRGHTLYIELTLRGTLGGRPLSWRACDRVTLRDGVATERESYLDPSPILAAVARSPRAWPRFLRIQARAALANVSRRRTR